MKEQKIEEYEECEEYKESTETSPIDADRSSEKTFGFQGAEYADHILANPMIPALNTPGKLYTALREVWSEATCAPRMRQNWTPDNATLGQCSITAFLVQDLAGGRVYGIPLEDGNFHCYNVVDGIWFDLTSEQFQGKEKDFRYQNNPLQSRQQHFSKQEKYQRYLLLKEKLLEKW